MDIIINSFVHQATVFPRVVPAGTIDFTYWIDAASIQGRPLFEGGFYFFSFTWQRKMEIQSVERGHHVYKCVWTPVNGDELCVVPEDHVYKRVWTPVNGDELCVMPEDNNDHNPV